MKEPRAGFRQMLAAASCSMASCVIAVGIAHAQTPSPSSGQAYPTKPIRLIIPYPPNCTTVSLGRTVVQKLGETLRQQVIADNRSGATGIVGLELAAKAPPMDIRS